MLWQTKTLATYIAATVPTPEGKETTDLLDSAKSIGEGILLGTESKKNEDRTPEGHPYNDYSRVMNVFGGQGNVSLSRYG